MFLAKIKTDKRVYNLYTDNIESDDLSIYGTYYENGKFYPLNSDILKEFEKLKLGENSKLIDTYQENDIDYEVFIDLDTNLKHYFSNGKESIKLFMNNFKPILIQSKEESSDMLKRNVKKVVQKSAAVVSAFVLSTSVGMKVFASPATKNMNDFPSISVSEIDTRSIEMADAFNKTPEELTTDMVLEIINNKKNISAGNKQVLYNREMLDFILPYVNKNPEFVATLYNDILPNFEINYKDDNEMPYSIEDENFYLYGICYYYTGNIELNKTLLLEFDNSSAAFEDTLNHEFIHVFQDCNGDEFNFLLEGLTELIANEFSKLDSDPINTYEVRQMCDKILMTTIGEDAVLSSIFTGDNRYIINEIRKYLSAEDANELMELFHIKDYENDKEHFNKMLPMLDKLHQNVFGKPLDDKLIGIYNNSKISDLKYYKEEYRDDNNNLSNYVTSLGKNRNIDGKIKSQLLNLTLFQDVANYNNYEIVKSYLQKTKGHNFLETFKIDDAINFSYIDYENNTINIKVANPVIYHIDMEKAYQYELTSLFIKGIVRTSGSNLLLTGCNNIILDEYYNLKWDEVYDVKAFYKSLYGDDFYKYYFKSTREVYSEKITKILIDVIGVEPIKYYYFTGDISKVVDSLNKYMDEKDVNSFVSSLDSTGELQYEQIQEYLRILINNYAQKNNLDTYNDNNVFSIEKYDIPDGKYYFHDTYRKNDMKQDPDKYKFNINNGYSNIEKDGKKR